MEKELLTVEVVDISKWASLVNHWIGRLGIQARRVRIIPVAASQDEYEFSARMDRSSGYLDVYFAADRDVAVELAEEAVVHELTHWILADVDVSVARVLSSEAVPGGVRSLLSDEWEDEIESLVCNLTSLFLKTARTGVWDGPTTDEVIAPIKTIVAKLCESLKNEHGAVGDVMSEILRYRMGCSEKALRGSIDVLLGWTE